MHVWGLVGAHLGKMEVFEDLAETFLVVGLTAEVQLYREVPPHLISQPLEPEHGEDPVYTCHQELGGRGRDWDQN